MDNGTIKNNSCTIIKWKSNQLRRTVSMTPLTRNIAVTSVCCLPGVQYGLGHTHNTALTSKKNISYKHIPCTYWYTKSNG